MSSRAERDWPDARGRLLRSLPILQSWEIIEGDYTAAPELAASWFIDPPYSPRADRAPGHAYGADEIDYEQLGAWCRSRRGQVIVCEQEGADWLPFRPLYAQWPASGKGEHVPRVEMVWTRTPGAVLPGTARSRAQHDARLARRRARRR